MKKVSTFVAIIYVGLKNRDNDLVYDLGLIEGICQKYCDKIGLCVTVTPTKFIYTNGNEPGAAIGFINYPRFPERARSIRKKVMELAKLLLIGCKQYKVSVVFKNKTMMLERNKDD